MHSIIRGLILWFKPYSLTEGIGLYGQAKLNEAPPLSASCAGITALGCRLGQEEWRHTCPKGPIKGSRVSGQYGM